MQASVAAEIRWRLDLYAEVLGQCRRGGFSLGRFLALVPDRLRLAVGDHGARIRVPVAVDPGLERALAAHLPGAGPAGGPRPAGRDELRRFIRLAQVHPDVDVLGLQGWLTTGAPALLEALARVYRRALGEVGRGEGGLELVYLVHLTLLGRLRAALDAARANDGARALVAAVLPQALARAAEASAGGGSSLPARLGLQSALTTSLEALGVAAGSWARLPANPRRTVAPALELARRVVAPPFETMPVGRVVDTVARRLRAEAPLERALAQDLLAEQVRDACVLLAVELPRAAAEPAIATASSSRALRRAVAVPSRRRELLAWLRDPSVARHRAAPALARLIEGAERVEGGDLSPLGVHGDLARRAEVAARGALLAALEAHTEGLARGVTSLVRPVAPDAQAELHRAGRCYRLALDEAPLYHLPDAAREAALVVDLSPATEALRRSPARRAAGLLDQQLLGPLLELVDSTPGVTRAGLAADRLAARGPVRALAEVAQRFSGRVQALRRAVEAGPDEIHGGLDEIEAERRAEKARIDARLVELDLAISKVSGDEESVRLLSDSKALLEGQRAELDEALDDAPREAPVVSMALTYGEVAEALPCAPEVAVSGPLTQAAGLLARTPWVARARASRLAMTRQARGNEQVSLPFAVSLAAKDGAPALYNGGCVLTDAARAALEAAVVGARVDERVVELRALEPELRSRQLFELDPEHFRVVIGADDAVVHALRRVGDVREGALWELLPTDLDLVQALFGPAREEGAR